MSSLLDLPPPPPAVARRLAAVPDLPPLDFDDVVRRLTPRLQRYATRRLGDRHEAEEVVQEALLRAYDHRAELATEDDVAAWSTCVTGRLVIDRLRVRGRSTSVAEVPEGARVGRDTADVVVARDEARLALDALDAMPARQAAVLWAREVEGLAYDEIGLRFGMTEPTVRSLLSRARKALRKEFASRGGTLPAGGLVALAPWVDPLGWVERLRSLAVKAAAPAALGVAGLGVLGGVALAPWSGGGLDARPVPAIVQASVREAVQTRPVLDARPVAVPVAAAAAAPVVSGAAAAVPTTGALAGTGVNDVCVDGGSAGAGGAGCAPPVESRVYLTPVLPTNPLGVEHVGLGLELVECTDLPTLPLTSCRNEETP